MNLKYLKEYGSNMTYTYDSSNKAKLTINDIKQLQLITNNTKTIPIIIDGEVVDMKTVPKGCLYDYIEINGITKREYIRLKTEQGV